MIVKLIPIEGCYQKEKFGKVVRFTKKWYIVQAENELGTRKFGKATMIEITKDFPKHKLEIILK